MFGVQPGVIGVAGGVVGLVLGVCWFEEAGDDGASGCCVGSSSEVVVVSIWSSLGVCWFEEEGDDGASGCWVGSSTWVVVVSVSSSSVSWVWGMEWSSLASCCLFLPRERVFWFVGLRGLGSWVEVFAVAAVVAAAALEEFLGLGIILGGAGVAAGLLRDLGPCVGVFFSGGWVALLVVFCTLGFSCLGVSCLLPLAWLLLIGGLPSFPCFDFLEGGVGGRP